MLGADGPPLLGLSGQQLLFLCCAEVYKDGRSGPHRRTVHPLIVQFGHKHRVSSGSQKLTGGRSAQWVQTVRPSFSILSRDVVSLSC